MKKIALVSVIVFGFLSSTTAFAARCPANDMGCTSDDYEQKIKDRIEEGKQDVREASGPVEKAKAVGRTVKDCTDCGMKVFKDSINGTDKSE